MKDSGNNEANSDSEWNWEDALKTAILVGISIEQFDKMTPYELALYIESYTEIKEANLQEQLTLVWLGEYYHRIKKLPSLKEELKKVTGDKKKVMSDDEMLEMVKRLNAQFGGTVKKGGE